ncbi:MAG: hypothetical protein A2V70_08825 [Planctomycetes bacterium RBG_13_63_9]|nr:MAG: hypothetical protein A2V70_08825 [Planctomycetes bacterium RBG_13_63_9]
MGRLALCLAVVMVLVAGRADAAITFGVYELHEYGGHYYGITQARSDWHASEAEAAALGGHLLAIGSQAEQEWINATFLPDTDLVAPPVFWVGLTDEVLEGTFVWTNGDPLTYTNWNDLSASGGPLEPNDWLGEDYVTINWHHAIADTHAHHVEIKGTWNDAGSDATLPLTDPYADDSPQPYFALFELESNPVPEPSSLIVWSLIVLAFAGIGWRRRRKA